MNDYRTIENQILSGIFIAVWVLYLPFKWIYLLIKWFIIAVFKETGHRLVKLTSVILVGVIVTVITHYIQGA